MSAAQALDPTPGRTREPPHNLEAERAVLGGLFIKPSVFGEIAASLKVDDFFLPAHREIFDSMLTLQGRQEPIDTISTADDLRVRGMLARLDGGEMYLLKLSDSVPTAENLAHYGRLVKEKAALRRVIATAAEIQSRAAGDVGPVAEFLAEAEGQIGSVARLHGSAPSAARTICMSSVDARAVSYLWPARLPAGMVGALDGAPGLGKASVILDLGARITTGRPWPGSITTRPPRDVVLVGSEDSPHHTIRPRLDAAGADVSRVHLLDSVGGRLPRFPDDADAIERVIRETGAVLMVIDPISAYIGGADLHRDNEVRAALTPLVAIAERTGAAILMIRHLRKSSGGGALNMGLGSIAISALARVSMMLLKDPDDESGEARILTWPKLSVGPQPSSLRWRFGKSATGKPPGIVWDSGPCGLSADDILDRQDARPERRGAVDETADYLRDALADGPVPSAELERRARAAGHSRSAYNRARSTLGVRAIRRAGVWLTDLPSPRSSPSGHQVIEDLGGVEGLSSLDPQGTQGAHQIHAGPREGLAGTEDAV